MMTEPALELRNISKRFGSVTALESVSLSAQHGSMHALLGENGAGKTTLMRIAFGMIRPDSGSISIDGRTTHLSSPADAIAAGIGMVHQQFSLVPAMTVAENVALGGRGRFRADRVAEVITDVGRRTGLMLDPDARVSSLGTAERQKLEIIRTLAHDARILILDEPTAVLTPRDVGELFTQLRLFAASGGCVILITHKLQDALRHADDVTVLRRGRVALRSSMSAVTRVSLTEAMLGSAPEVAPFVSGEPSDPLMSKPVIASFDEVVLHDRRQTLMKPVSLDVHAGEILGVAALEGAAGSVLRALAGRLLPVKGSVEAPHHAGFVAENRQDEAIIPDFTLTENFALKNSGDRRQLVDWDQMQAATTEIVRDFDVKAADTNSPLRNLSGGNQQRFVLGRELEGNPSLLILENPTHGLDVKATAAIHARIRTAAQQGVAVVFYSSDLDELAEIADRVVVVRSSGFAFSKPDRDVIGRLLLENDPLERTSG